MIPKAPDAGSPVEGPEGFAHQYASVNGTRIHHVLWGQGPYASRQPDEVKHLEQMNPATGGYCHYGFHLQVELATALTLGGEATHLMPFYKSMSVSPDAEALAVSEYLPFYTGPQGLRGAFEHHGTLLDDGRANRADFQAKIQMPVLLLNGERGIRQKMLLDGIRQVAEHVEADIVPGSGHTLGRDSPIWVAERLIRFLAPTTQGCVPLLPAAEWSGEGHAPRGVTPPTNWFS